MDRIDYLQSVGRDADVFRLIEPFTRDIATTVADRNGMWLINEGVYTLLALGHDAEARALMARLTALPIDNPELINPVINRSVLLVNLGRPAEALAHALDTQQRFGARTSAYGHSAVAASIVCALAALDRRAEVAPWLARLRAPTADNPLALLRAELCLGDLEQAEMLVLRLLRGNAPEIILIPLQIYELTPPAEANRPVDRGLAALRERPAVRAALAQVGHILTLPMAR
jgi:hypothetical protein